MGTIRVDGVTKQFGTTIVLDDVSLEIHPNERVGLIGTNGSGKTTLFRIMSGQLAPDLGTVIRAQGMNIGLLSQDPDLCPTRTVHDEAASAFDDLLQMERKLHELSHQMGQPSESEALAGLMDRYDRLNHQFISAGGHTFQTKLNEILGGLGFSPTDYDLPVQVLSGGQQCRVALAKLLLKDCDLLLLDEPTNHLDIDAVAWLEKFLGNHAGNVVIVSHDRYLLDRVCTRIIEIENTRLTSYPGNYSNFAKTKELRILTNQRNFEKDAEFIKKERAFIAKHLAGQRTKEAQGRRTRLERRLKAGEFRTEVDTAHQSARFQFETTAREDTEGIRCEMLQMRFDDNELFRDLSFQIQPRDRFAITGPNGTGKTTLLRIILGEIEPTAGRVSFPPMLRRGYFSQHGLHLEAERTVLEELREAAPQFSEFQCRSLAARFRFCGDDVFKRLGSLSGGEESRLRLATLILDRPDILLLDEPTNHLDIPSREALEDALREFDGTILFVSHDRYLIDRIADRLLVMRSEGCRVYHGNYSYYLEQTEQTALRRCAQRADRKDQKRNKETTRTTRSEFDHLSIDELEELVIHHEVELAAMQERFGDPAIYKDPEALADLRERAQAMQAELAEVDRLWQDRVESQ
ncbi:MAG: ABC-F family ATP-binding cassette domain-containing protein [Phycisphaerae bacterium]